MEQVRSLYKSEIDFAALALQSRDFAKQFVSSVVSEITQTTNF